MPEWLGIEARRPRCRSRNSASTRLSDSAASAEPHGFVPTRRARCRDACYRVGAARYTAQTALTVVKLDRTEPSIIVAGKHCSLDHATCRRSADRTASKRSARHDDSALRRGQLSGVAGIVDQQVCSGQLVEDTVNTCAGAATLHIWRQRDAPNADLRASVSCEPLKARQIPARPGISRATQRLARRRRPSSRSSSRAF